MNDWLQRTEQLSHILRDIPKQHEFLRNEIQRYDNEMNDLQHELEFDAFDAPKYAQIAAKMRRNRLERRKLKDEFRVLEKLYTWRMEHVSTAQTNALEQTKGAMRRTVQAMQNRIYTPRVQK